MKTYIAYISTTFKLTMRDRMVLFFNYLLPMLFFVVFAQSFHADRGGAISQVISMVLIMGVLGSGFFGAGLRAVQERELNILRRFKVAPITPLPILISSLVTGAIAYLPGLAMILLVAHFYYGMPWPERLPSLIALQLLAIVAFRSIGLMIASVVNTMQESQIIIQLLYLPMLFLSGATFPISMLPAWLQAIAQFLPASYLYTGLNGILIQRETLAQNSAPVIGMVVTTIVALLLGVKLFRWEKEERLPGKAKLWLAAVMLPFLVLGAWQAYSKENVVKAKILSREMRRNRALLIRGPRILIGDGKVIPMGSVLIRDGRIEEVYAAMPPATIAAEVAEATGKTLMPGLMDAHVHLAAQGGVLESYKNFEPYKAIARELAAYLYCGVTAVKSAGDPASILAAVKPGIVRGERLGAELLSSGKLVTVAGGHGTEFFDKIPGAAKEFAERETLALPKNPDDARRIVRELKLGGADAIKAILESGEAGHLFPRMDREVFRAVADEARAAGLPLSVHTGDVRDVTDAIEAGAASIEHGSTREAIPDELFARMARQGIAYDPTLVVLEAINQLRENKPVLLDRSLVQQVAPPGLVAATRKMMESRTAGDSRSNEIAQDNLVRAWKAGVTLVTGTDSGNLLLVHGPAIHRELQLWVQAGIPAAVAIQAATGNTAKLLRIAGRTGMVKKGFQADLLLVDGNPLEEIAATERISAVLFRGEAIDRQGLFEEQ